MARRQFLTDAMWAKIDPLLPEAAVGTKGGRPWRDNREVLEGILWILCTGGPWADLPEGHPSPSSCWRRYRKRWKIERTFAWLGNFRRLVVRYERDTLMYSAFFHLACCLILVRWL